MQLVLNVVSYHKNTPGQTTERAFENTGGTIGRAPTCDWILPDPQRYLSSLHAEIKVSDQAAILIDHSTNGTFINKSSVAIGRGKEAVLQHGDTVEMGDFIFSVEIINNNNGTIKPHNNLNDMTANATVQGDQANALKPMSASDADAVLAKMTQEQSSEDSRAMASAALDSLLNEPPQDGQDANLLPDDWNDLSLQPSPLLQPLAEKHDDNVATDPVTPAPSTPPVTPQPIPEPQTPSVNEANAIATTAPPENDAVYTAFLRGLGINESTISGRNAIEVAEISGKLLRTCLDGYLQLIKTRASIKSEIRADQTLIQTSNNNPLKFSMNVDDALFNLLSTTRPGFIPPIEAMQETVEDVTRHQVGILAGLEAINQAVLDYFNPETCQIESSSKGLERFLPMQKEVRAWETFNERYEKLLDQKQNSGTMLFEQQFQAAYKKSQHA